MRRSTAVSLLFAAALPLDLAAQVATPPFPTPADIQSILVDRVDKAGQGTAMVMGTVSPEGQHIFAHGVLSKDSVTRVDGDTVFEIGSVTKVFTALLLADAVERGRLTLDDRVAPLLQWRLPERGRAITLRDLVTHTSGLPRLPTNLSPADRRNPYADYTLEQLRSFLESYALPRDVGAQYEYSNLSGGLLGYALERQLGASYEVLVASRITAPLDMRSTTISLPPALQRRLALGYDASGAVTSNWDLPTLAGAGALRSTASDLLRFLSAALQLHASPLDAAFTRLRSERRPTGITNLSIALGWHVFTANNHDVFWHDGGTGGYRSFIGFDPVTRLGVVVLSNGASSAGVTDIGRHLLDARVPLLNTNAAGVRASQARQAITVSPEVLEHFIGQYALSPQVVASVTCDGSRLFIQLTGQPAIEFFAESATEYFARLVDAQVTFESGSDGRATALVIHQNGREIRAVRAR